MYRAVGKVEGSLNTGGEANREDRARWIVEAGRYGGGLFLVRWVRAAAEYISPAATPVPASLSRVNFNFCATEGRDNAERKGNVALNDNDTISDGTESQLPVNDVNFAAILLGVPNLIFMTNSDVLASKLLPWLATHDFLSAGNVAGTIAFAPLIFSHPSKARQWLGPLAGMLVVDLAGLALVAICAIAFGTTGLIPDVDAVVSEPRFAITGAIAFLVLTPLVGGMARLGLLPAFHWTVWGAEVSEAPAQVDWFPPRFANFLALLAIISLATGYAPPVLIWIAQNWPDSSLNLIHREFAVLPLPVAAVCAVGTPAVAREGRRPWPMTGAVALIGMAGIVASMALLAVTSPIWAWPGAGRSALSAIVTGLPGLALIPVGISVLRNQQRMVRERNAETA